MRFSTLLPALCLTPFLAGSLAGQEPLTTPPPAPQATSAAVSQAVTPSRNLAGLAHVALRVADLEASTGFYEKLGFVRAFALSRDGKVYEAFLKINDRQFLELYPATPKQSQVGFLHLCFEGKDIAAVQAFYVAAGLKPTPVKTAGAGNLLFTMPGPITPQGPQNMEYTQYMPGSMHSKDFGQHLGKDRIATAMTSVAVAADDPDQARTFYREKAGFLPGPGGSVILPGAEGASLEIVPASMLGFHARFTLRVASLPAAEKTLRQQAIAYRHTGSHLSLVDPDGNEIVLQANP